MVSGASLAKINPGKSSLPRKFGYKINLSKKLNGPRPQNSRWASCYLISPHQRFQIGGIIPKPLKRQLRLGSQNSSLWTRLQGVHHNHRGPPINAAHYWLRGLRGSRGPRGSKMPRGSATPRGPGTPGPGCT